MFFWNITSELLKQNLIENIKNTPMFTISDSFFGYYVTSGFGCWTTKARLLQKNSGFRAFCLFSSSCAEDCVHHFCPISVSPKKPGTKSGTFSKNDFALQKEWFEAKKAPKNH